MLAIRGPTATSLEWLQRETVVGRERCDATAVRRRYRPGYRAVFAPQGCGDVHGHGKWRSRVRGPENVTKISFLAFARMLMVITDTRDLPSWGRTQTEVPCIGLGAPPASLQICGRAFWTKPLLRWRIAGLRRRRLSYRPTSAGALFTGLPRPEPLFFPPPVMALTVAQARFSASSSGTPLQCNPLRYGEPVVSAFPYRLIYLHVAWYQFLRTWIFLRSDDGFQAHRHGQSP